MICFAEGWSSGLSTDEDGMQ